MLSELETPAVVVDDDRLKANIARVADLAGDRVRVLPHAKTHKSTAIARMQIDAGAEGITVSKSEEAVRLMRPWVGRMTVAYPLVNAAKVERVLDAAATNAVALTFVADSPIGVEAIARAADPRRHVCEVMIKVDVGLGRCGIQPSVNAAIALVKAIEDTAYLRFGGLISHAGQSYGAKGVDAVRSVAREEKGIMTDLRSGLEAAGVHVPCVSVGSTPTVLANDGFDGIDEIRPGNYVFLDMTQVGIGVCSLSEVALSVVTTVVSANDRYLIIDAGSKVLSSDLGPHGSSVVEGHGFAVRTDGEPFSEPGWTVAKLSEEHGFVEHRGRTVPIGTRLRVYPNHSCVVVNLADQIHIASASGGSTPVTVDAARSSR